LHLGRDLTVTLERSRRRRDRRRRRAGLGGLLHGVALGARPADQAPPTLPHAPDGARHGEGLAALERLPIGVAILAELLEGLREARHVVRPPRERAREAILGEAGDARRGLALAPPRARDQRPHEGDRTGIEALEPGRRRLVQLRLERVRGAHGPISWGVTVVGRGTGRISTRRFFARLSGVSLDATGWFGPKPAAKTHSAG